ncbi:MAG: cation:proton antiporter [Actinomycetota bacterium]|nr:cation:proton antiporter [Actinomycetota bacterium]
MLLDIDTTTALLIGAVVSSTDAAAVFSLLRRSPLPGRLRVLLEAESGGTTPWRCCSPSGSWPWPAR